MTTTLVDRGALVCGNLILILTACMVGLLFCWSPTTAFFVTISGLIVGLAARKPLFFVGALIVIIPFAGTLLLRENLLALPGSKPFQLFAALVAAIAVGNLSHAQRVPRYVLIYTLCFVALFTVCVLRGWPNMQLLTYAQDMQTPAKIFLTQVISRLAFFLPFVVLPLYCQTVDDLDKVVSFLVVATVALASYLVYLYAGCHGDIVTMTENVQEQLLLHRNSVAGLLMCSFPFLFARFMLHKSVFSVAAIVLTVAGTCVLFSRSAYVILALSPFLYAFVSGRRWAIPILLVVMVGLVPFLPSSVLDRAQLGFESGDVNEISAGRVETIWRPLLAEYLADPPGLIFGRGRYAMLSSEAMQRGLLFETESGRAHNIFLELIIETGILGLCFTLMFLAILLRPVIKTLGRPTDVRLREYSYAVVVSAVCFLVGGLTDRTVFPERTSSFFWVTMAIAVVIPLLYRAAERDHNVPDAALC